MAKDCLDCVRRDRNWNIVAAVVFALFGLIPICIVTFGNEALLDKIVGVILGSFSLFLSGAYLIWVLVDFVEEVEQITAKGERTK